MKHLKFNKRTLIRIQDEKLKGIIGAEGEDVHYSNDNKGSTEAGNFNSEEKPIQSCCKQSCNGA